MDKDAGLIESGEAWTRLDGLAKAATKARYDVIVIGGGQAGLAVGYHLRRLGLRFVILDAQARIGDAWRRRWDSLRLFTPAKLDGIVGMRFPAPPNHFPTKDEMADYLEAYAARFELPVRTGVHVERLFRRDGAYVVKSGALELEAPQVVVAMSNYQRPKRPPFAAELRPDIVQLNAEEYLRPSQLRDGGVLIVGVGNSGAEIALELRRREHQVFLAGRPSGEIPFRLDSLAGRLFLARLMARVVFHRVLTVRTPMGRKARPKILASAAPLIRTKTKHLAALGVEQVARVVGVRDGLPVLADGRALEVANVVWCTGYHPGFSWIDLPVLGGNGEPLHESGVVPTSPGLYFVGLHFLYAMSSSMIHGVSRDAGRIARAVSARAKELARGGATAGVSSRGARDEGSQAAAAG